MKKLSILALSATLMTAPAFAQSNAHYSTTNLPTQSVDLSAVFDNSQDLQVAVLSQKEMQETEGEWWFVALPLARAAIWAAPRIAPKTYRVINNTKTQHTVLLKNNVHKVQIGVDKHGRHVGWGTDSKNHAKYHIYQNDPWKVNPYSKK